MKPVKPASARRIRTSVAAVLAVALIAAGSLLTVSSASASGSKAAAATATDADNAAAFLAAAKAQFPNAKAGKKTAVQDAYSQNDAQLALYEAYLYETTVAAQTPEFLNGSWVAGGYSTTDLNTALGQFFTQDEIDTADAYAEDAADFASARDAYGKRRYRGAIEALSSIYIFLFPNSYSSAAQKKLLATKGGVTIAPNGVTTVSGYPKLFGKPYIRYQGGSFYLYLSIEIRVPYKVNATGKTGTLNYRFVGACFRLVKNSDYTGATGTYPYTILEKQTNAIVPVGK